VRCGGYRDWPALARGRAQLPRIALDAETLGRVAGGNRHGGFRQRLHDDDRLPAQSRVFLLFARREEGVQVEEQTLHRIFGG